MTAIFLCSKSKLKLYFNIDQEKITHIESMTIILLLHRWCLNDLLLKTKFYLEFRLNEDLDLIYTRY